MAFKSFSQYQEDKNGCFFVLPNNGDFADVVFLYKSANDVLIADAHYLKTPSYSGYVHCCEKDCPACNYLYTDRSGVQRKGIDRQAKMFIPLYNITKGKIEFWDRTPYFEQVLQDKVFKNWPDPSQCVFRIKRNGMAGDRATKYEITPIGRNTAMPYEKILADFHVTLPDYYSVACKEMSVQDMSSALSSPASSDLEEYGYTPVPRGVAEPEIPAPTIDVPTPVYNEEPEIDQIPSMPEYVPESPIPDSDNSEEGSADGSLDDVKF